MSTHFVADDVETYLGEKRIYYQVQETTKRFIAHEDSEEEIAQNESAGISPRICPNVGGSKDETRQVQAGNEKEEFPRSL